MTRYTPIVVGLAILGGIAVLTAKPRPATKRLAVERQPTPALFADDVEEEPELEVAAPADPDTDVPGIDLAAMEALPSEADAPPLAVQASAGFLWADVPEVAPGKPASEVGSLDDIRAYLVAGDTDRALWAAEAFVADKKRSRDRDAADLLIGMIHREAGRHNSASDSFSRVRQGNGPLAPFGAWYEAEQDLLRGKSAQAVRRCTSYRETWPEGVHFDQCNEVIARGQAAQGHETAARAAAKEWDTAHPLAPIGEQVELQLGIWEAEHDPNKAVVRLRDLSIHHRTALTGRVAEELLVKLHSQGVPGAEVPTDIPSLQARSVSLRDSGRTEEAWAIYEDLLSKSGDDPALQRWCGEVLTGFSWRTRHFDRLIAAIETRYAANPTAGDAYNLQKYNGKAGNWKKAGEWIHVGLTRHAGTREWRGHDEEFGRFFLLAGDYKAAKERFDVLVAKGGVSGHRAEFYSAFAVFLDGDNAGAVKKFDVIAARGKENNIEAHWWRSRALDKLGKTEAAAADRQYILDHDPLSWYGVLARNSDAPDARNGRWPGPDVTLPALPETYGLNIANDGTAGGWTPPRLVKPNSGFAALSWSPGGAASDLAAPMPTLKLLSRDPLVPPASYPTGTIFEAAKAREGMKSLVATAGTAYPVLSAIQDLARVGLYDLSGPLFAKFREDWRTAAGSSRDPHHAVAKQLLPLKSEDWRSLYLFTRDHNHTARYLYGVDRSMATPEGKREALKLAWPLAHDRYVWTHGSDQDVDPYLVTGLMRQESTYNPIAMSPVGARGAMQIMPRTGHLLADITHDTDYTSSDLEDPVVAVGFGIRYMGLLLERFDGNFPLAVAAYNCGPHNVSSWLHGTSLDVPTDVFVESIPLRETRNYVKQVSENYATYLALYAPGTPLHVPDHPTRDDASIVDF